MENWADGAAFARRLYNKISKRKIPSEFIFFLVPFTIIVLLFFLIAAVDNFYVKFLHIPILFLVFFGHKTSERIRESIYPILPKSIEKGFLERNFDKIVFLIVGSILTYIGINVSVIIEFGVNLFR